MDEKEKILLRKKEDMRFVQGCWCVAFAIVLELILFQIRDYYFGMLGTLARAGFLLSLIEWGRWFGLALAGLGLLWFFQACRTGKGDVFYPIALFLGGLVMTATAFGIYIYGLKGLNILLFLVPAWAGLGLVFFLYQVEFFISAFFTGLGGVGLWLCGQTPLFTGGEMDKYQKAFYLFLNLAVITIIGGFYLMNKAFQNEGVLVIGKQELTVISDMKDNSSLWLVGLSAVMSLVSLAIAMTVGFTVIYYLTIALLGWLFILLVYYTVKMM